MEDSVGRPGAGNAGAAATRAATDAGVFRDKVAAPDPAAAPLGTDDEAAGAPAQGASPAGSGPAPSAADRAHGYPADAPARRPTGAMIGLGLVAVIAVVVALWQLAT